MGFIRSLSKMNTKIKAPMQNYRKSFIKLPKIGNDAKIMNLNEMSENKENIFISTPKQSNSNFDGIGSEKYIFQENKMVRSTSKKILKSIKQRMRQKSKDRKTKTHKNGVQKPLKINKLKNKSPLSIAPKINIEKNIESMTNNEIKHELKNVTEKLKLLSEKIDCVIEKEVFSIRQKSTPMHDHFNSNKSTSIPNSIKRPNRPVMGIGLYPPTPQLHMSKKLFRI
ncbi:hypothetical protein A3Q56_03197 [Intoshia linei]|uniref:Uncharacterized protein n=1 Tax=Intoshia linei TaxID=1819745 RepID=A0A177B641_9BILA|nr:hypothetical protein A3Q56_03197 [Intoshia linei]